MSRKGHCDGNAMMGSFFRTLRAACTDLDRSPNRVAVLAAVFDTIQVSYNRQRLHLRWAISARRTLKPPIGSEGASLFTLRRLAGASPRIEHSNLKNSLPTLFKPIKKRANATGGKRNRRIRRTVI